MKEGKVENCSRTKDENGRLAQGEDEVRRIWNYYFEDLYNIDTQVHMCGFDGLRKATISEESHSEDLKLR